MTSPYEFLLVSRRTAEATRIREEISRNKLYRVQMVETAFEATMAISAGNLGCLVFNFETFSTSKIKLVTDIRDLGHTFPIAVFATHIQREAFERIQKTPRIVIIEKPFEAKDVWGICEKFVQGRKVEQRVFRRFYTDQSAAIEKTISGETMEGQIYNLSRGGAYVELTGRVTPGEMVRMSIRLEKIAKNYNVDAQVVWSTLRGSWGGKPAAGVRFMKAGDVYRNLLDKL